MNVLPILAVTLMGLPNMLGMNVKAPATNVERRAWVTRERKTRGKRKRRRTRRKRTKIQERGKRTNEAYSMEEKNVE